jgi:hypothetical protein
MVVMVGSLVGADTMEGTGWPWLAGFFATKHSWRGKYKRLFLVGRDAVATLNPLSYEETNKVLPRRLTRNWAATCWLAVYLAGWTKLTHFPPCFSPVSVTHKYTYADEFCGVAPSAKSLNEFVLTVRKKQCAFKRTLLSRPLFFLTFFSFLSFFLAHVCFGQRKRRRRPLFRATTAPSS